MVVERRGPKRRNMFGETRLLSEWLAREYPGRRWHLQFRVGSLPARPGAPLRDEAEERLARNAVRHADAVVEPPPNVVLIEATMFRASEKVGKLLEYMKLWPGTPEASEWAGAPLLPVLLTGQHDPTAEDLCRELGIRYVFFEPAWIDEWYALYPRRRRRATPPGTLTSLGIRRS